MNDIIQAKGEVYIKIFDKGILIEETTQKNLIVNVGKQNLALLLGSSDADKRINKVGFGTNGTAPVLTDTSLTAQFSKSVNSVSYVGTSLVVNYSLEPLENNGVAIRELALLADDGTLFSRISRNAINKTSDIRLEGTWTITF